MWDLKSGDAAVEGSREYADYREQLISKTEAAELTAAYQEQAGILTDPKEFVRERKQWLSGIAEATDRSFPENDSLRIENGEPVLAKLTRKKTPARLPWLESMIRAEMPQTPILDALADTENLLQWTRFFGPLSGLDTKLENPRERYLLSTFCYGCNLGPSQTARSVQGTDRRQIAWVNQRHIAEDGLDEAITTVINAYNNFALPRLWGSGKHASADGTRWDLYEQRLLRLGERIERDLRARRRHDRQVVVGAYGECHAPVAGGAVRIELRGACKRACRFIVIKRPQESHALIEVLLSFRRLRRDLAVKLSQAFEHVCAPCPIVNGGRNRGHRRHRRCRSRRIASLVRVRTDRGDTHDDGNSEAQDQSAIDSHDDSPYRCSSSGAKLRPAPEKSKPASG
jgi:hypothetical protein